MKIRMLYLCICTVFLITFVQCKDSVTQSSTDDVDENVKTETAGEPLPAPAQVAPENEATGVPLQPSIEWEAVEGAEAYILHVSHGNQMVVEKQVEDTSFIVPEKLSVEAAYYWRVKAVNGQWSEVHSFTTTEQETSDEPLPAPAQVAPENEATGIPLKPSIEWEAVEGAEAYTLHVSHGDQMVVEKQVEGTSFTISEKLSTEASYYWRVKALNGEWSEVHSFTTTDNPSTLLPAPDLVAPANNAGEVSLKPSFEWGAVEGAESYTLQVNIGDQVVAEKMLQETSFTLSDELKEETNYSWKVKASGAENDGEWAEVYSFTTTKLETSDEPLPAPAQVAPENEATGIPLQPSIEWEAVEGAEAYTLHVSHGDQLVVDEQVEGTSFSPSEKLSADAAYYWRVKALKGEWSEVHSFTTMPEEVDPVSTELQSPTDGAGDRPVDLELKWKEVAGATGYKVQLADGEQFNSLVVNKSIEATSYNVSDLEHNENYAWRVEPVIPEKETVWSEVSAFTTTSVPVVSLLTPDDGAANQPTDVSLEWNSLSGISQYYVQVASGSNFTGLIADETTGGTTHEVSGLDNDQTYYWRVQAANDGNSDNWSEARSFRTEAAPDDGGGNASADREALMDLYEATGGNQWANNSGWGQGAPSSSWHGIQVNSQGQVTRIDLFNNGLNGQLPESIGDLKTVTYVNLKNNRLTGPIPPSIGSMESLQFLILSGRTYDIGGTLKEPPSNFNHAYHPGKYSSSTNRFSGTIPASIGQLSNLELLEISDQPDITGPIPSELGQLSRLKGLYLNWNDFDGHQIPESLGNLTQLRHFYIYKSDVIGQLPEGMKNMTNLTYLSVVSSETRGKGLTGSLPDLSNLTNLRSLVLDKNEFDGEYPSYFNNGNFTQLNTLRITWSNLTGELHGFNNLQALQSLGLEGNNLSGPIRQQLAELPDRLQILGLGWNNFSGELPQSGWTDFYQLKTLYLNDNNLTGAIPCDFWNKIDNPRLNIAWLSNNNFSSNCTSAMNSVEGTGNPEIRTNGNNF